MSWTDNKANYQDIARSYHPGAKLVDKSSWFFKLLALFAAPFVGYSHWLEHYALAIGPVQAYPSQWGDLKIGTIIHECRHSYQCEVLGWLTPLVVALFGLLLPWTWCWIPLAAASLLILPWGRTWRTWAGLPLFLVLYFTVLLPIGLSVFKCWFELDANRAHWRHMLAQGHSAKEVLIHAAGKSKSVNGKGYGYALPWLGRKWFMWAANRTIKTSRTP